MNPMDIYQCFMCGEDTGPEDLDGVTYAGGACCGSCMRRLGLSPLVCICGMCKFPILGKVHMIDGRDYEYCTYCHSILVDGIIKQ